MFKAYNGIIVPQLFGFLSIVFLVVGLLLTGINIMWGLDWEAVMDSVTQKSSSVSEGG